MLKRPLKYEDLPAVFTPEILEVLLDIAAQQTEEWKAIYSKMTPEQFIQYSYANTDRQEKRIAAKRALMSQDEQDAAARQTMKWAASRWYDDPDLDEELEWLNEFRTGKRDAAHAQISDIMRARLAYQTPQEQFTFFSGKDSPFASCFPQQLQDKNGEYVSLLHFIVRAKAHLFIDRPLLKKLPFMTSREALKEANHSVQFFSESVWKKEKGSVLREATRLAAEQSPQLREALLATQGTTIVLADPADRYWGIGLSADQPEAQQRDTWKGKNLWGELWTERRIRLTGRY